jgi:hypothetical protein
MEGLTEKAVINKYERLVCKQQELINCMSNLGREKDYKVQKIEKEYESKIDKITRELQSVALQIDTVRKYVIAIGDTDNPAVMEIKKEGN